MKQKEKSSLKQMVPALRFPEFVDAGDWIDRKLGDLGTFLKGKGISKADLNDKGLTPCIRYGELYTVYGEIIDKVLSKTSLPTFDLVLSVKNDVIVPSSGETKIDIAKASCVLHDGIALGGDLNVFRSNQNGNFISYLLNGPSKIPISKLAQGDTVVHLYSSQLSLLSISIPSLPEQEKIADCLSSLDEVIQLETKKWESLKSYKKGLLQKLFPAEGETVPELRFPENEGTGDWEERKLGEVCELTLRNVDKPKIGYLGLGVRSHGKGTFQKLEQDPKGNSMEVLYQVHENDLIVSITFAWEGAVAIASKKDQGGLVSHRFPTYVFKPEETSANFFRYIITKKSFVYKLGLISPGGAGRNRVMNKKDFLELKEYFPSLLEQQKIADCLSSLDGLIQEQAEKVEGLKAHKKGLLQGLFPVIGE